MNRVLTLKETAEMFRVHPSTIYRLLKKSKLPAFRVGSDWHFNRESIDRWVLSREGVVLDRAKWPRRWVTIANSPGNIPQRNR
jgi:excisionase family DNA binding protein